MNEESMIFALDIGTRSVVGVVGTVEDSVFHVVDFEQAFHSKRAMRDGQIEDIDLVSRVVREVKKKLEERLNITFTKVSIAAAGRALKTVESSYEHTLSENGEITEELVRFMESSAIGKAQETYGGVDPYSDEKEAFYCVGYSVAAYYLDDYPVSNLEGHRGIKAKVDIIAAFLPYSVVRSLYAVTSRSGLDVDNLTLEPIAAINVIVPPDVRLLNVALVDIGAGTSDIAISKNGSIVAYDMVTVAGDEISEAIMHQYLTDFQTAEDLKQSINGKEKISFKDILGNTRTVSQTELTEVIQPSVNHLCEAICERILEINKTVPAAIFLVGGGSQIPGLCQMVAKRIGLPEDRVAHGGTQGYKYVKLPDEALLGPAYVTPLGIGTVSTLYRGCDFFSISVNQRKVMLFSHGTIKVLDALLLAGIKPSRLISIVPPSLTYYINGHKYTDRGTAGASGKLFVNGNNASIDTSVSQGDKVEVVYAENGIAPETSLMYAINRYLQDFSHREAPSQVFVNEKERELTYLIQNTDEIRLVFEEVSQKEGARGEKEYEVSQKQEPVELNNEIKETTIELVEEAKKLESMDSVGEVEILETLSSGDNVGALETLDSGDEVGALETFGSKEEAEELDTLDFSGQVKEVKENKDYIYITLNGNTHKIQSTKNDPAQFLNLLTLVEIDTKNPQGELLLTLNGKPAGYTDFLSSGDVAEIGWSVQKNPA